MVDIIRRKNVNLESPDVSSGAKATANAVRTIGSGVGSAMQKYGARLEREQEKADKEYTAEVQQNLKEAQTRLVSEQKVFDAADKLVATDMAGRLKNDLLRWNLAQRESNPSYIGTAEHEKRMRDEYARLSSLYGQGLGEAGAAEFQERTQPAINELLHNDINWAYKNKLKAGENSAKTIAENMNKTAKLYGATGDVDGFKQAYQENRDNLEKYAKKTGMKNADKALLEFDALSLKEYANGVAESNPEQAILMFGSKDDIKEMRQKQAETDKDKMGWAKTIAKWTQPFTGYVVGKVTEKLENYIDSKKLEAETEQGLQEGREKVSELAGEELQEQFKKSYVDFANAQIAGLKEQQKRYSKKSDSYKSIQNQIDEIQGKIDNADSESREMMIKGLGLDKTVVPAAKKQMEINAVQEKKMAQEQELEEYTLMLSPDQSVRVDAQMAAVLGQPVVEQLFGHSISNEEMQKATNALHESEQKVSPRTTISWTGTKQLNDAIVSLASYNGDNPLEVIKLAMDAQTSLNNSGEMTEGQKDEARNIIYGMVQDKAFADTTKAVLENNIRYYPDTNWIENIFLRAAPGSMMGALPVETLLSTQFMGKEYGEMGLVSGNISTQDVDSVQKYLTSEYRRITKDLITMIAMAAQLPTQEERIQAVNDAGKYMETEKRKVYDTAMMNYGIDLAKLREVKNTKGQAFTMIGTSMKEYVGDDPSTGEPIWKDLPHQKQNQVYLERLFGKNKSSNNNSAENKNGK